MAVLNYDDVIKKSSDLTYYFGVFWKILCSTTLTPHLAKFLDAAS